MFILLPLFSQQSCEVFLSTFLFFFKILFIYFSREGKGRRESGRETSMCGCLLCACPPPTQEPGPQPRHVPWLGIKLVTLWFAGWCSIHWATPTRALSTFLRWGKHYLDHFKICSIAIKCWSGNLNKFFLWTLAHSEWHVTSTFVFQVYLVVHML